MNERELIERLKSAGWVVVSAEAPDGNLVAVMLFQHHAAPYPVRDTFLHLSWEEKFPMDPTAQLLGVRQAIRVQAPTLFEALKLAAAEAALEPAEVS